MSNLIINPYFFSSGASEFQNAYSVLKGSGTGSSNYIALLDSNSSGIEFDSDDAWSFSIWVKPGWSSTLNAAVYLFSMSEQGANGINDDTIRMWYAHNNNRINVQWRTGGTQRRHNFWLFHSTQSQYLNSYNAAGLGTTYWSSSNKGNRNSDDYVLITWVKGASNSAAVSNMNLYWNQNSCNNGFYVNGNHHGTPSMSATDKQIALGSTSWDYSNSNANGTKFDNFSIWNKKLTTAEVGEIWNSGTAGDLNNHSAASNLKGYWRFENNGNSGLTSGGEAFSIAGTSQYVTI